MIIIDIQATCRGGSKGIMSIAYGRIESYLPVQCVEVEAPSIDYYIEVYI